MKPKVVLVDPTTKLLAENVTDLEDLRKGFNSRIEVLTRQGADSDGVVRGAGLPYDHPTVARLMKIVQGVQELEDEAIKHLQGNIKASRFRSFIDEVKGLGYKQAARLLGDIGDPFWHQEQGRPRTVSELWAYCGYSVINGSAQQRKRGSKANWNPTARSRAFLISQSLLKTQVRLIDKTKEEDDYNVDNRESLGVYGDLYLESRKKYQSATHQHPCAGCGSKGVPAPVGSPLRPAHQNTRAIRRVSKEVLKDLWIESRRLHGEALGIPETEVVNWYLDRWTEPEEEVKS